MIVNNPKTNPNNTVTKLKVVSAIKTLVKVITKGK